MPTAPLPADELRRLRALSQLDLLDTPAEQEYDDITGLASFICQAPMALICLVDAKRQWFKSRLGIELMETPRDAAICAHTILGDDLLEVSDALDDKRFRDNPFVRGDPYVRFYAGVPLTTSDNYKIGTLCVFDTRPRHLNERQRQGLRILARQVMRLIELQTRTRRESDLRRELHTKSALSRAIIDYAGTAIISVDHAGTIMTFNPAAEQLLGYSADEVVGIATAELFHDPQEVNKMAMEISLAAGEKFEGFSALAALLKRVPVLSTEWTYIRKDKRRLPIMLTFSVLKDEEGRAFGYLAVVRDLSDLKRQEQREQSVSRVNEIVRRGQHDFITGVDSVALMERLLFNVMTFSLSERGFIGEVISDENGAPFLKIHAVSEMPWLEESGGLYRVEEKRQGPQRLFDAAIASGKPVFSNEPLADAWQAGLSGDFEGVRNFLCMPFHYGDRVIGLMGLADRKGVYDMELVGLLFPLGGFCASLFQALRLDAERSSAEFSLARKEHRLRQIIETAAECFIEVSPEGCVLEWNLCAEKDLKVSRSIALGANVDEFVRFRDPDGTVRSLLDFKASDSFGQSQEVVVVLQDGAEFDAELAVWFVWGDGGRTVCAFLRNISQRKEFEMQQRLLFQSDTLLKEVHHRIKNNMQVISSLLSIQSSKLKDEVQRSVFIDCRERIRAMSLIHDRLYSTGNYARIDFGEYLKEMVPLIASSNRPSNSQIVIDLEIEPIETGMDHAVPLSLIAAELVLNSLKHAVHGRSEGSLIVRLMRRDSTCVLFVGDDGSGMQAPTPGQAGVGFQLVESLTRQIRGRCEMQTGGPGAGTSITWEQ